MNWRIKAIENLEKNISSEGLHYSSVITLSNADFEKISEVLIQAIEMNKITIKDSSSEIPACFNIDFFKL